MLPDYTLTLIVHYRYIRDGIKSAEYHYVDMAELAANWKGTMSDHVDHYEIKRYEA